MAASDETPMQKRVRQLLQLTVDSFPGTPQFEVRLIATRALTLNLLSDEQLDAYFAERVK